MHFWRADRLADELRAGELTEQQKFSYVAATTVLHYLVSPQSLASGPRDARSVSLLVAAAVLSIGGLYLCFRANQRGDGRAFVERYLCLAMPIAIRVYVIGYVLYYLMGITLYLVGGESATASLRTAWGTPVIFGLALLIAYLALLRHYVARAAGVSAA